jgi:hypothetical protein
MNKAVEASEDRLSHLFLKCPVRLVLRGGKSADGHLDSFDKEHFYLRDATYYVTRRVRWLAVPRRLVELIAARDETADGR